ncbi:hypothetical protein BABINDRAFT_163879 [Babjeviella inositovora NRRL Y-12698]|uniref:C2H2-type domain-containing protein n=1 Tax=Babjeviella inositovora NRRL Y-12698 TaxID=984486 RepID=A0A1E3QGY8_9ASCO|nr:uncharacterized protein BABINDRAFT_163879 [Babjeviella inositovora NRRL Y-12698]ODQ76973.1 hypothetical protein BABINDRAFT_163879 [Babjeviella inositovora NRRL Y-12698]
MPQLIDTHLQPHTSRPSASHFTCNTCGIQFPLAVLQRQHMKTDWHRYNLKRRVAQLEPLTSEVFAGKVLAQKAHENLLPEVEDEYGFVVHNKIASSARQVTKKDMRKQEKIQKLARGRAVAATVAREASPASVYSAFSLGGSTTGEDDTGSELNFTTTEDEISSAEEESEEETAEEDEMIEISECLFCGTIHASVEDSADHMFQKHGLYIPHRDKLVDLSGLIQHLIDYIVDNDNRCLNCSFAGRNLESTRQHMLSKAHCRLRYETKEDKMEVEQFYRFEASPLSGLDVEMDDDVDSQYQTVEVDASGVELVLPTGSRIGHRSMNRYYRQRITEVVRREDDSTVAVADGRYNGAGLVGQVVSKEEKLARLTELKHQQKIEIAVKYKAGKKNRGNFQKHFRDEILQ